MRRPIVQTCFSQTSLHTYTLSAHINSRTHIHPNTEPQCDLFHSVSSPLQKRPWCCSSGLRQRPQDWNICSEASYHRRDMRGADVTSQPNSRQGRGAEAAPRHVTHRPQHVDPPHNRPTTWQRERLQNTPLDFCN